MIGKYLDMTRPTTSSITAALTSTEPTRVCPKSTVFEADDITANVVPGWKCSLLGLHRRMAGDLPKEVADNAAPIINVSTAPEN